MRESQLPQQIALKYWVAPHLKIEEGKAIVRSVKGLDNEAIAEIELLAGYYVENHLVSYEQFQKEFEEVYPDGKNTIQQNLKFKVYLRDNETAIAKTEIEAAPVVKLVDGIISRAIEIGASDVHLEPRDGILGLRYRIDGVLQEQPNLPYEKKAAIISRVKIMADLDIAERRRPQDGRIRVEGGNRKIDLRVSIISTDFGEKVAIRILDKAQLKLDLDNLGMNPVQSAQFKDALSKPNGIILVTGPTGSGKTTTLYAALNYIKNPHVNILTIEDPIEYNLDGISQSQVKREIGYDFAHALRTFLRQDPDIILVGEIRDNETAEIAIRAALTGHLVLSTLHTNDAVTAMTRLIDIGIQPYLVASTVNLVMAQRLVRVLCSHCKLETVISQEVAEKLKHPELAGRRIFEAKGCPKCHKTGYIGRTAVFESMPISASVSDMIHNSASLMELRAVAQNNGMISLSQSAVECCLAGYTSISEMNRII